MGDDLASNLSQLLVKATKDDAAIPGAVVAVVDRKGALLFHQASGRRQAGSEERLDKDALFWIASCTKVATAIAAMQLVEQGKLSLDEPVRDVVPQIEELERDYDTCITLRHLLTHTAGMSYPSFNHDTARVFHERQLPYAGNVMGSLLAPLNAEPGTRWEYGCSLDWVGLAIEAVSGIDLDTYFKTFIFEPLGVKRITLKPQTGLPGDESVVPHLAGMNFRDKESASVIAIPHPMEQDESKIAVLNGGTGGYANTADYVQVLAPLLNDGKHPVTGAQVLTPASVEELFRDQLSDALVRDLYRPVPDALPMATNALEWPGAEKQWTFLGLKNYDGPRKEHSFVWWAGLANSYWIVNRELGYAAMIQTQLFPFADAHVMSLFFDSIHPNIQAAFQQRKYEGLTDQHGKT